MTVWAIANQKGGVGKTTTVISLASHLALKGHSILLLDMDPHGSLTTYFGFDPDTLQHSIYTLFQHAEQQPLNAILKSLKRTEQQNIYLLPAATAMATLDRQLGIQSGKGLVIHKALQQLNNRFEYVLIDCPPMLGVLMVNALAACDMLLIPVQTEFLALKGLERMLHTVQLVNHSRQHKLPYFIVPTMFDRRTRAGTQTLRKLQQDHEAHLWQDAIPIDTQFRDASKLGIPLPALNLQSRGSMAYARLMKKLMHPTFSQSSSNV